MRAKRTPIKDMAKMAENLVWDGVVSFTSARSLAGRTGELELDNEYQRFLALDIFDYFYSYDLPPLIAEDIEMNLGTEGDRRTHNKVLKAMVKARLLIYTEDKKYQLPPELDAESRSLVPLVDKKKLKAHQIQRAKKFNEIFKPKSNG